VFGRRKYSRRLPWYRRLRSAPISRDDSGYYSAFLVARPMLGDLCARDTGGGDWRPCPMAKCQRPDHDHVRHVAAAEQPAGEAPAPQRASGSTRR
jgi:hypothetical protein